MFKKQETSFADKDPSSQSYGPKLLYGPQRRLSAEELMLLNCDVGEDSWGLLGLQDQTNWS